MPEGDTIHRAAARLRNVLAGHTLLEVRCSEPVADWQSLSGTCVSQVEARGKHLLIHFSDGQTLHSHLGMHGSWQVQPPATDHAQPTRDGDLCLQTDSASVVCARPKVIELLNAGQLRWSDWFQRLGPDLLGGPIDEQEVVRRFRTQGSLSLGETVMNQTVISGVGNIYKSEVLFLERISPFLSVDALSDECLVRVVQRAARLMQRNLNGGRRRTRFRADGPPFWVYDRSGEPCLKCEHLVRMKRQGDQGRSTYYCSACQQNGSESVA